jgi:glycosyltransferase involved in cell wall biosynthesis
LIPLEAMACGKPVLAFNGGGAPYTVARGVTGDFFDAQTPESIVEAVERFDPAAYDPARIRAHAEQWDREAFRARVLDAIAAVVGPA